MKRRYITRSEMAGNRDRSERGESLDAIAVELGRYPSAVQVALATTGGIRPAPGQRLRVSLTLAEREEISRGIAAGMSLRAIAVQLGRAPSTISREVNRNGARQRYRANQADDAAWERAQRAKTCKLAQHPALARIVTEKLMSWWSPRQIAGWLKRSYPDDGALQVSHETTYKTLFIHARGALKKELIRHLRRNPALRRSRHHTQKTADRGRIVDAVSMREREHQRTLAAVLPERHGLVQRPSESTQCRRTITQRTAAGDATIIFTGRKFAECVAAID